jgi:hypothetical protein
MRRLLDWVDLQPHRTRVLDGGGSQITGETTRYFAGYGGWRNLNHDFRLC